MERELKYLKIDELKDGYLYRILARNAKYGIWKAEKKSFIISRVKFGDNYIFEEDHWDADPNYGTAKPLKEIEKYPEGQDMLEYLNPWEENNNIRVRGHGDQAGSKSAG